VNVIVDTPIWSLALRRRSGDLSPAETRFVTEWRRLVRRDRARIVGPIRQELLSGLREAAAFERLRGILRDFEDEQIVPEDYEEAARFTNRCRSVGIASSAVDALLCAVAVRLRAPVFTTDADFARYARHLPLRLHKA
jgi:predicted nucleic acid-binding protein